MTLLEHLFVMQAFLYFARILDTIFFYFLVINQYCYGLLTSWAAVLEQEGHLLIHFCFNHQFQALNAQTKQLRPLPACNISLFVSIVVLTFIRVKVQVVYCKHETQMIL